jgi:hypothetical protein
MTHLPPTTPDYLRAGPNESHPSVNTEEQSQAQRSPALSSVVSKSQGPQISGKSRRQQAVLACQSTSLFSTDAPLDNEKTRETRDNDKDDENTEGFLTVPEPVPNAGRENKSCDSSCAIVEIRELCRSILMAQRTEEILLGKIERALLHECREQKPGQHRQESPVAKDDSAEDEFARTSTSPALRVAAAASPVPVQPAVCSLFEHRPSFCCWSDSPTEASSTRGLSPSRPRRRNDGADCQKKKTPPSERERLGARPETPLRHSWQAPLMTNEEELATDDDDVRILYLPPVSTARKDDATPRVLSCSPILSRHNLSTEDVPPNTVKQVADGCGRNSIAADSSHANGPGDAPLVDARAVWCRSVQPEPSRAPNAAARSSCTEVCQLRADVARLQRDLSSAKRRERDLEKRLALLLDRSVTATPPSAASQRKCETAAAAFRASATKLELPGSNGACLDRSNVLLHDSTQKLLLDAERALQMADDEQAGKEKRRGRGSSACAGGRAASSSSGSCRARGSNVDTRGSDHHATRVLALDETI